MPTMALQGMKGRDLKTMANNSPSSYQKPQCIYEKQEYNSFSYKKRLHGRRHAHIKIT